MPNPWDMDGTERRQLPPQDPLPSSRSRFWWRHPRLVQLAAAGALTWGVAYLVWRVGWSGRETPLVPFLVLLAAEVFGWVSLTFYAFLAWRIPEGETPALPLRLPTVDVFVCTYDEASTVLEPTLVACRAITVPHTTYVLDDGRRPEIRALAERMGAEYVTRPDNSHAKAGNINHALGVTAGELILFLDADHVPLPHILDATVGYFGDPQVALVQAPHDFSNRDSVQHTRTERHEQTLFYDVIAPGKDRHNAAFWCGSATLVRRTALEEVGGVLTDTVAEDFHTTIAMHARGWRTRYHRETLVQGLAPHNLAGFLLQRARWARGNLGVFRTRENPLTCRGLTFSQRVSYFASLSNYFSGLQRLALLLVLTWTLATGELPMRASVATLLCLWLPWSLLAFVSTGALGRGALGVFDSTRYGIMTIGIYLRGILALFSARAGAFKVTPKEGIDEGGFGVLRMLGLVTAVTLALLAAWLFRLAAVLGLVTAASMPEFALGITLALGVWEIGCVVAVLTPLVRRRQVRRWFRFPVTLSARIDSTSIIVRLVDLTPAGIGFESTVPIAPGRTIDLLTRLPGTDAQLADLTLPVEVRSCRPVDGGDSYRIGGAIDATDAATNAVLLEYLYVALPEERITGKRRTFTRRRELESERAVG